MPLTGPARPLEDNDVYRSAQAIVIKHVIRTPFEGLSASKRGSDAISLTSGRSDDTCFQQIELPTSIHLPLDEF